MDYFLKNAAVKSDTSIEKSLNWKNFLFIFCINRILRFFIILAKKKNAKCFKIYIFTTSTVTVSAYSIFAEVIINYI